jgi:C-terminal processing protease CtpA/Prc
MLPGNVGLLDLAFFMRPSEHREALASAMKTLQPAAALILDMRSNGGGSPDTVALLVSYLLDTPRLPLFEIRHRDGRTDVYATAAILPLERNPTRPVYVLTSASTFSAGEGLPFLLQELGRATIVGEPTAGAANPGRAYPIDDVFEVAVPNGQVVTARGRTNWEGSGVTPDVQVASERALNVAHLRAIDDLLAVTPPGVMRDELLRTRAGLTPAQQRNLR